MSINNFYNFNKQLKAVFYLMKDRKAVALPKLFQEIFLYVKLSLKNGVFQELQLTEKSYECGSLKLSWFRKSETEDVAVEDQFFLRMGLAWGLSDFLAFRKVQGIKNMLEDMPELQAKLQQQREGRNYTGIMFSQCILS